ncbi:MAG TPA: alpha/beta fold hydrolase [Kiritimatiellia bacterium]|nr:alpha/beta fold hydrolase [Kiritimatiellia bacterium]
MQRKRQRTGPDWSVAGELVAFPAAAGRRPRMLDGFYRPAAAKRAPLVAFVHGMGSNFYRSGLKKAFLETAPARGCAVLSFNNRGAERGTEDENFSACLADLDAALAFARRRGHRKIVFVGHSTGCQKIAFWQARRRHPGVAGLVLLAPADDYAVTRQDFGARFEAKVAWARRQVAQGRPGAPVVGRYERFTAARFLSLADPRRAEANVFRYAGPLTQFRRVKCPVLAVFGENEEFAAIPPADMLAILRRKTQSRRFADWLIPGADHGFHGMETELAEAVCRWVREVAPCG